MIAKRGRGRSVRCPNWYGLLPGFLQKGHYESNCSFSVATPHCTIWFPTIIAFDLYPSVVTLAQGIARWPAFFLDMWNWICCISVTETPRGQKQRNPFLAFLIPNGFSMENWAIAPFVHKKLQRNETSPVEHLEEEWVAVCLTAFQLNLLHSTHLWKGKVQT